MWLTKQRAIYGWIRRETPGPRAESADLPPLGSAADLRRLDAYWQGLWCRPADELDLEDWTAPLGELPPMPALAPLTAADLQDVVRQASKSKAPGADGWTYQHMATRPPEVFEILVRLLRQVEAKGEWPAGWAPNTVCLLAKNGTRAADDRRPIVLLSAVYRLWAAAGAKPLRRWLCAVGVLPGCTRGADEQAGLLGLHMDVSHADGGAVHGLTVDWSKCYDRLPLDALEAVATAAGVPPAIWKPMLAAYRLPRLVRADGLGGHARVPRCGLAPGCPAATDWLALVMHCWSARLRQQAPALITRTYVDDLSAYTSDQGTPEDVAVAWAVTQDFGAAFHVQLNPNKCLRYSTAAAGRQALQATPGPPVLRAFRDLGVTQRVSRQRGSLRPV